MAENLNSQIDIALGGSPIVKDAEIYEALIRLHTAIEILVDFYDTAGGLYVTTAEAQTITGSKTFEADLILASAINLVLNATTGTKIGTATSQKLGFWNKTPIIQPAAANQAALTNNTAGTRDGTLSVIAGTGDDATLNDNFTDIHELLNAMRTALVNSGIMKGSA